MLRVIDVETTGTDPSKDKVIEIASIDVSREGVANSRRTFVNPGIPIPPQASAIHHIIDADVAGAPALEQAIAPFKMRDKDFFIAHNSRFDEAFLGAHLGGNWIDTYRCALRIWPDAPAHTNQALRYMLGLVEPFGMKRETITPHRAIDDCIVTAAIFLEISKIAKWSDIVYWSSQPALFTRVTFGKHYGQRWDEVPTSYIEWVLKNLVDDRDQLHTAAYWLDQRKQKGAA